MDFNSMASQHFKAVTALTVASILLLAINSQALLQYWQQTHHQLMHNVELPQLNIPAKNKKMLTQWQQVWNSIVAQGHYRMTLAGQILLQGNEALPKPVLPEIPACPELAPMELTSCDTSADVAQMTLENAEEIIAQQTLLTTQLDQIVPELAEADSNLSATANEITAEAIASAQGPIVLQANDKVLLIGDSLMQGLAPHLNSLLKKRYSAIAMDLSRHSTGLTYTSFFDWPATVNAAFELEHYACVIVFLGANDPWDMSRKGGYIRFGSDEWKSIYRERVASIINTAATHDARVIWLGAPPMGREDLAKKIPVLNEIYQTETEKAPLNARYLATAPSITENGTDFTKFLDLPEQGSVMIRADDGVHFTTQGQRLLVNFTLTQFISPTTKVSRL
jgi:hypothetical protein